MWVERLARGLVECVNPPGKKRYEQNVVNVEDVEHRHQGKDEDERRRHELARDNEAALVEHIGEYAAE